MKLLIATNNPGKMREYEELLSGLPVEITFPCLEGLEMEVEEVGKSYAENALLKATSYAKASGLVTLADDSGLEVDALGGGPGIRSSRYGGEGIGDEERYLILLENLSGVPWEKRTASFRCVIAIATPEGEVWTTEGECEGIIAFEPRGEYGFGYDPVFYLLDFDKTMAELPLETKNRISHRAHAARKAREILKSLYLRST
jgi:XTP/dITP diphosphohydrolase